MRTLPSPICPDRFRCSKLPVQSDSEVLDAATDQQSQLAAVTREAVKALLIANEFIERELATQVPREINASEARAIQRILATDFSLLKKRGPPWPRCTNISSRMAPIT